MAPLGQIFRLRAKQIEFATNIQCRGTRKFLLGTRKSRLGTKHRDQEFQLLGKYILNNERNELGGRGGPFMCSKGGDANNILKFHQATGFNYEITMEALTFSTKLENWLLAPVFRCCVRLFR